jgi:hypothetical protein
VEDLNWFECAVGGVRPPYVTLHIKHNVAHLPNLSVSIYKTQRYTTAHLLCLYI